MKYEQAGTYELEYKAVDECGNEKTATRIIIAEEPVTYKTTLFTDGTLIINEPSNKRADNITEHGAVDTEYVPLDENNGYNFTGTSQRPWNNKAASVKSVKFGSEVTPVSIAYWFQASSNLESIDWENFDGSEVTTARALCSASKITSLRLPTMPKLTNIRYICNQCTQLETADFSRVRAINLTDMIDAFQGCYALTEVDLTSLSGTVATCDRAFANVANDGKGDMQVKTIYADSTLDFSQATSSGSMFRSCTSLVGGNGTTFNSNYTNKAYARIDTAETPGYFTEGV